MRRVLHCCTDAPLYPCQSLVHALPQGELDDNSTELQFFFEKISFLGMVSLCYGRKSFIPTSVRPDTDISCPPTVKLRSFGQACASWSRQLSLKMPALGLLRRGGNWRQWIFWQPWARHQRASQLGGNSSLL